MPPIISLKDLSKTYKSGFEALKGISLEVEQGDFFGLLGPNGAGKTTTLMLVLGFTDVTSGRVLINGIDVAKEPLKAKKHIISIQPLNKFARRFLESKIPCIIASF